MAMKQNKITLTFKSFFGNTLRKLLNFLHILFNLFPDKNTMRNTLSWKFNHRIIVLLNEKFGLFLKKLNHFFLFVGA